MTGIKNKNPAEIYLALPPQNPRYYLPLKNRSIFFKSLFLYRPASPGAVLKKRLLSWFYPIFPRGFPTTSLERLTAEYDLEGLRNSLKALGTWAGVYIPPGGDKAIIQVLDEREEPAGFLKIGLTRRGGKLIKREVEVLGFLSETSPSSFSFPRVLSRGEEGGKFFAFLSTPPRLASPSRIPLNLVLPVIREVFSLCPRNLPLASSSHGKKILERAALHPSLGERARLLAASMGKRELPLGCAHYDFKLWNIFLRKETGKPFVIDWEFFKEEALPLWDLFTFLLMPRVLNSTGGKISPGKIIPALERTSETLGFRGLPFKELLGLYLIDTALFLKEYGHRDSRTSKTAEKLLAILEDL